MEIHDTARQHGVSDADILHAIAHAIEVLELDDDRGLIIHAMPLRSTFFSLLSDEQPRP